MATSGPSPATVRGSTRSAVMWWADRSPFSTTPSRPVARKPGSAASSIASMTSRPWLALPPRAGSPGIGTPRTDNRKALRVPWTVTTGPGTLASTAPGLSAVPGPAGEPEGVDPHGRVEHQEDVVPSAHVAQGRAHLPIGVLVASARYGRRPDQPAARRVEPDLDVARTLVGLGDARHEGPRTAPEVDVPVLGPGALAGRRERRSPR